MEANKDGGIGGYYAEIYKKDGLDCIELKKVPEVTWQEVFAELLNDMSKIEKDKKLNYNDN